VVIGILIPMIYFDALPTAQLRGLLLAPPPPAPTPPPPPPEASKVVKFIPRQFDSGKLMAPHSIPPMAIIKEDELPALSAVGSVGGVSPDALVRILGPVPVAAPPPPPSVQKSAQTPRIRVGGIVQSAKLVLQLKPVYPQLAK
jgi:protein TonB